VSDQHSDALASLRDWAAPDPAQERLRDSYVDHLERNPDGLTRSCFPDHVTAGALIVSHDRSRVLLNLHAKANLWFAMGGHCEEQDPTLAATALREAREESGVTNLVLDPVPVQLDRHQVGFCNPRGTVAHLDVRYVAVAPADAVPLASDESHDVRWWPVDALPDTTDLPGLVKAALARLQGVSPASI